MEGAIIEFDVRTPLTPEGRARNAAWSMARGYREVQEGADKSQVVNVIANGPSARNAPQDGLTVALNGALALFRQPPTFWAACDPQALVANFLRDPPKGTTYLVASKCHRRVFNALRLRPVLLWHVDDTPGVPWGVECATSITLVTLSLFRRMGYRNFRVWGWDGCYVDGQDHAVPQPHKGDDRTIILNDRSFQTTTAWAVEAQDAVNQLAGADYRVQIEGDGMIKAIVGALVPSQRGLAA